MQVYLVSAPQDQAFAKKLQQDLEQRGFTITTTLPSIESIATDISTVDAILVLLSDHLTALDMVTESLEHAKAAKKRIIALRIASVSSIPNAIRGVLPLDFSTTAHYTDSFETLIEDLEPPTVRLSRFAILPEEIQRDLDSDDVEAHVAAIQRIGEIRHTLTDEQLRFAENHLRSLAFSDTSRNIKGIARATLQLLNSMPSNNEEEDVPIDEADTAKMHPIAQQEPPPSAQPAPTDDTSVAAPPALETMKAAPAPGGKSKLVIYSRAWWMLPIFGVVLAIIQSMFREEALAGLPTAVVWLALPWFNMNIRDGGRLDWKMPGPVVGNAFIGLVLSIISGIIVLIVADIDLLDFILISILGIMYGILIGWLSSLYAS